MFLLIGIQKYAVNEADCIVQEEITYQIDPHQFVDAATPTQQQFRETSKRWTCRHLSRVRDRHFSQLLAQEHLQQWHRLIDLTVRFWRFPVNKSRSQANASIKLFQSFANNYIFVLVVSEYRYRICKIWWLSTSAEKLTFFAVIVCSYEDQWVLWHSAGCCESLRL